MRRGILGGTFDPPHLAHLVAAETAYRQLGLDVVTFLPAGSPWQKAGHPVSEPEHRWEMTRLAIEGAEYFAADPRELRRDGPTYTIDTLATFPPGETLLLILGHDAAAGLPTWHRAEELVTQVEIVVAPRPGTGREEVDRAVGRAVQWLAMPALEISGTMIRQRLAARESVRFLVPDRVWHYIVEHELYGPAI
ncbi:MAG: nicotinate-nucleotide adenylyltransferase [Acidimicrobiia bacterium]